MKTKLYYILSFVCMFFLLSCNKTPNSEETIDTLSKEKAIYLENKEIASIYQNIYEKLYQDNLLGTTEGKQKIADCLGRSGYIVSDTENQINMKNFEQAERFCKAAKQKQNSEITILLINNTGGFIRYDLNTSNGEIDIASSALFWQDNKAVSDYYEEFRAHSWSYTDKGYLFIEQYRPPGYDGAPGQTGIRIKPLDQKLRDLNTKYVAPIGYVRNKLFITNWSEDDYNALDFYDLYEIIYKLKYNTNPRYESGIGGNEYEIPEKDFEEVIQTYFPIDGSTLKELTSYSIEKGTYRYRPRGLYDAEYPYEPYPEVIAYEEQPDGILKLTVEAVWIYRNYDCAAKSELTVHALENGEFQYISNKMITSDENIEAAWYSPRLTDEEWTELYEGDK